MYCGRGVNRNKNLFLKVTSFITILIVILLVVMDIRIRPMLYDLAHNEAKRYALIIINSSVSEVIEENQKEFNNLTKIEKDSEGRPIALTTDALSVDTLVSKIFSNIHKSVENIEKVKCEINLGSITKSAFLYGKGPEFNIRVQISQYINYEIISSFSDAGINQTKNSLYLRLTATIYAVMPGDKRKETVSNDYLLSETVLLGEVPDGYTEVIQVGSSEFDTADTLVNFGQ